MDNLLLLILQIDRALESVARDVDEEPVGPEREDHAVHDAPRVRYRPILEVECLEELLAAPVGPLRRPVPVVDVGAELLQGRVGEQVVLAGHRPAGPPVGLLHRGQEQPRVEVYRSVPTSVCLFKGP